MFDEERPEHAATVFCEWGFQGAKSLAILRKWRLRLAANCGEEYIIYHEASTEQGQLRTGFGTYLERDHPNHPFNV